MAAFNKPLGKFQPVGSPAAPRGMQQVDVAFDIGASGIINVSAKDLGSGNEQKIQITGGSGLKDDEVERMVRDAEAHADEARRMRELAEARNQAETLIYTVEKALNEHREAADEETVTQIESRLQELRGTLESENASEIRTKSDELSAAFHQLSAAIYEKVQAEQTATAGAGATGGDGASAGDDEVVEEADYEVIDEEAKQS